VFLFFYFNGQNLYWSDHEKQRIIVNDLFQLVLIIGFLETLAQEPVTMQEVPNHILGSSYHIWENFKELPYRLFYCHSVNCQLVVGLFYTVLVDFNPGRYMYLSQYYPLTLTKGRTASICWK